MPLSLRATEDDYDGGLDDASPCWHVCGLQLHLAELIAEKRRERERSHPTVMGSGLAIPHATVPGLDAPVIGVARATQPVQFGPEGTEPVSVFFVLLSPPGRESEHVKLLARICRLGRHENFLERLDSTGTEEEILQVIESIDAQHV